MDFAGRGVDAALLNDLARSKNILSFFGLQEVSGLYTQLTTHSPNQSP
jgi:hypothetical protein